MTVTIPGPADTLRPSVPAPSAPPRTAAPLAAGVVRHRRTVTPPVAPTLTPVITTHGVLVTALRHVLRTWSAVPDLHLAATAPGAIVPVVVPVAGDGSFVRDAVHASAGRAGGVTEPALAALSWTSGEPQLPDGVDLHVGVSESTDGLRTVWTARAGVVDPDLLPGAMDALDTVLATVAAGGHGWHRTVFDLVPTSDRALAEATNDTAGPVPDVLLHELMSAAAARTPTATAVVDGRRRLSYAELDRYARRIGRRLRSAGVGPGDLVAIALDKGWEQYAAVYGVLTAGAAYLPLDVTAPAQRLSRLLDRGEVRHVLTRDGLIDDAPWATGVTCHRVDTGFETPDDEPLTSVQTPTDLAYVIFTSGSTGEPKGVMVDHRGVVNLIDDVNTRFRIGPDDRAFSVSALHFDASVYDVFGVIAAGGTVVLPDPATRAQPDLWTERARAERVTVWNSVPAVLDLVVGQAETRDDRPLASVRLAVVSGDWIPLTLPERLRAQCDDLEFVGSGGPTETICWSVFQPVTEVDPRWASIPYGRPITNQRYLIVDDRARERPVGVVGEMAVVSDIGLAHGYFADPELTAQRFVTLPESGRRAYLTGDLGRRLPDGSLEILGRSDFQVKIQGYRIELGEIEAALREHPDVSAAVVVAPRSVRGGRKLSAFVVGDGSIDPVAVRATAVSVLPGYMVPATVHVVDALPLTGNGKIDRRALAERAAGRGAPVTTPVAPAVQPAVPDGAAPLVDMICRLMGEVLETDVIARGDNFFRMGGDSVSGARLGVMVNELLGVTVPLRLLFEHPVPTGFVTMLLAHPEFGSAAGEVAGLLSELDAASTDDVEALLSE